jgi:hypothetical protein
MKLLLATLAVFFSASGSAIAADFECVWRELPSHVRAAFTRNTRTSDDIRGVLQSGVLTDPILIAAMGPCGVQERDSVQLGQYITARALMLSQRSRLMVEHGWHESQFAVLMATVTTADRDIIWRSSTGEAVSASEVAQRLRANALAQGLPDEAAARVVLEYMYAQIVVERMAPEIRP